MYMLKIQVTLIQYALWYIFQILLIFHDLQKNSQYMYIVSTSKAMYVLQHYESNSMQDDISFKT